jgi:hypothetical protein
MLVGKQEAKPEITCRIATLPVKNREVDIREPGEKVSLSKLNSPP